jgi:hypothetical protein
MSIPDDETRPATAGDESRALPTPEARDARRAVDPRATPDAAPASDLPDAAREALASAPPTSGHAVEPDAPSRTEVDAGACGASGLEDLVDGPDVSPEAIVFSPTPATHYFAFELETLATLSALGRRRKSYPQDFWKRKGEFLAAVLGTGAGLELRLVSQPDAAAFTRGRVVVALIARVAGGEPARAAEFAREVHRLQKTTLPEYRLRALTAAAVGSLLAPLRVEDTAELRRRVRWVHLDTRRAGENARVRVGFSTLPDAEDRADANGAAILHVFPFNPSQAPLNRLFELLLTTPGRICLSFRVEPATLSEPETEHLESQIALCESHAQTGLRGSGDDLTTIRPTLQVQARSLERLLSRSLDRMRRSAVTLRVRVAADRPLPGTVLHQVGRLLSAPVTIESSGGNGPVSTLVGGYEVVAPESKADPRWLAWEDEGLPAVGDLPGAARRLPFLFPLDEAAGALQLPPAAARAALGVEIRGARELVPPHNLPLEGLLIGRVRYQDSAQDFRVAETDRQQHVYVCGQTGTGKSTLLAGMILADIHQGEGICVIDPHGDLYHDILQRIPPHRAKDVVLIDPTDHDWPVGVNLLEVSNPVERHFAIDAFISVMERVMEDLYGVHGAKEYAGPAFWQQVRMNLSLLTHDPSRPATLVDFCAMFQENGYWKKWTPLVTDEPQLRRWVENTLPNMDYTRTGNDNNASWGIYVGAKFENFIFFPPLRRIFGQVRSTIDFRQVMDEGKILLVNLAKGDLTEINSRFLGMILLAKLQSAAMSRTDTARDKRRPFYVYVDEFGAMATRFFVSLLSEGRKFGISLVLANQFQSQIHDETIREAIFGNVGTMVAFRTGHDDAVRLAHEFYPGPTPRDFVSLPNWRAYTRAVVRGQRLPAFVLETIPLEPVRDEIAGARARAFSRVTYGSKQPAARPVAVAG